MWLSFLASAAAGPVTDLCNQPALDASAKAENARWTAIGLPQFANVTHTLSDQTELTYNGVTLRKGDRVSVADSAGTFKPEETGHSAEVRSGGQVGTVRCFTRTVSADYKNDLVVVRWDAQAWKDESTGKMVSLPVFEDTVHPSYLAPTSKPAK